MAKKQAAAVENRHYDVVLAPHITEKSTMPRCTKFRHFPAMRK